MSSDYPLVLLPNPTEKKKNKRSGGGPKLAHPDYAIQRERVSAQFSSLQSAIDSGLKFKTTADGIEPELALVFEVAGSLKSFYGTVSRIDGFEWIEDFDIEDVEPDDLFYAIKDNGDVASYTSRVYCVMSNKKAFDELLSYWEHFKEDKNYGFERGYGSLGQLFSMLRNVRTWNANDRLEETGILESWKETAEVASSTPITFEAELFFRADELKRGIAASNVERAVKELDGSILDKCVIEEIGYHGLLISLPRKQIEALVSDAKYDLELINCEDVMFFRPAGQLVSFGCVDNPFFEDQVDKELTGRIGQVPRIALLDGLPMQNHSVLKDLIIVDDPDDFGSDYPAKKRRHGTAMASVIAHGDLDDENAETISSIIYARPVMKACPHADNECYPQEGLFLDLIHRAVVRMFRGEAGFAPVAPSVKIINFSLGSPSQQYLGTVSSLAKLLDWLSYEYKVLFVISSGNQDLRYVPQTNTFSELKNMDMDARTASVLSATLKNTRNHKLLSPSESLNSLTVGATFDDSSTVVEPEGLMLPVLDGFPNPASSLGPGIGRSIKPEILYPGGRYFVCDAGGNRLGAVVQSTRQPGFKVASPGNGASIQTFGYESGTSISAALVTHEAALCYDVLDEVFETNGYDGIPRDYAHLLLKAMLVHGARWSELNDALISLLDARHMTMHKVTGYGKPDIAWAKKCAANRVTAIGFGEVLPDKGQLYSIPLPIDIRTRQVKRKLAITLAYMSPVAFNRKEYKRAQVWFDLEGETKSNLIENRQFTNYQAVRKGTVQHEVFEGERAIPWDEDLSQIEIAVSCSKTTELPSLGRTAIPYALFVTFEAAEGIDVYLPVVNKLRTPIGIS